MVGNSNESDGETTIEQVPLTLCRTSIVTVINLLFIKINVAILTKQLISAQVSPTLHHRYRIQLHWEMMIFTVL